MGGWVGGWVGFCFSGEEGGAKGFFEGGGGGAEGEG